MLRPTALCRSWLFVPGADDAAIATAAGSGADVLIHELEDFTPPALRPKARALAADTYARWRAAGFVVAVRINPLDGDGLDDLVAVMHGHPDIVALPKAWRWTARWSRSRSTSTRSACSRGARRWPRAPLPGPADSC